ncbi:glycosyltransferase family 4 protein [Myroides odoratimimus]|uniref:glycosyltransferase family 4 protein n=1 Tax=Myroides odoratimimus TaxID=76832 RepID=UPI0025761861|nr:glycosyltransferase family 4 protein [Myroides odoratimimus]MDM1447993.1 glycosyltransferase family 4 protein [Myroides odoratimimus]
MKVLIEAYNTYRQNSAGGVQTRITNLLENFIKINSEDIEITTFNKWNCKIDEYDLIHFFKSSIDHYNLMMFAKSKNISIVLSSITPIEGMMKIKILLLLSKYLKINTIHYIIWKNFDLADIILAQTTKEKKFISSVYGINQSKIRVLPNGIADVLLVGKKDDFRKKYNIQGDFALMVGRVDSNKNQLGVIKALKHTDIQLVIIGGEDPEDQTNYMERCLIEGKKNVKFIGWLDAKDPLLASAYTDSKMVILASHKEIYGNCIYEGLANNCYIAYSNVLEIEDEYLKEYIRSFDPNDLDDIYRCVEYFMHKADDIKIDKYVREKYSWKAIAQEHLEIYREFK